MRDIVKSLRKCARPLQLVGVAAALAWGLGCARGDGDGGVSSARGATGAAAAAPGPAGTGERAGTVAAGAAAAGGGGGGAGGGGPRLNLLLVTLDTVRADHLGCYGGASAETPTLDGLAREGVRFAHAASPVPLTLPAHTSILTGLLPARHGVRNNGGAGLAAGFPTLATRLAAAGYRTGAFVSAFVLDHRFGLQAGFATYDDEVRRDPNAGWVLEAQRPGDQTVDRALAWLDSQPAGDQHPFFLWVHLYDVHAPYNAPPPYRQRHAERPYDGALAFDDAQLGRLLAGIDRRGGRASTLVAVAADHGESLGEHGEATHGLLLYEGDLAVPLLLRGPGLAPGVVATPVGLIDLAPTLAGLLGLGSGWSAAAIDGRDLSAGLRGRREPPPTDLYAETRYPEIFGWQPLAALRRRDLKYIAAQRPELYDLTRDPREQANLAATAAAAPHTAGGAPAAAAGGRGADEQRRLLQGFAARVAGIAADALRLPPPYALAAVAANNANTAAPSRGAGQPAAGGDAEARARLESLGYVTGGPAVTTGAAEANAARRGAAAPYGPEPSRQVELFQRFERAHDEQLAGNKAAAQADLEALVASDPPNPVFRAKLAQVLRERGDLARAIPLYRSAAAATPADPEAWYNLAAALSEAGQLGEARTAIEKALRLDPGRPEAHNTLGLVLLGERKPEDARREFAAAVAADPRNAHAWNNLGNVLRALGRPADADHAYRQALAAAPDYPEALNGLGTLAVQQDQPAAALPLFDRALALAPGYHEVRLNRAIALQMAGNAAAAAGAYRDFLAATDAQPRLFAEQRQAARHFLDQLTHAGAAPPSRQPPGGR